MLWSIMDETEIFRDMDKIRSTEEYTVDHRRILGYPTPEGKVCIVRILSSDPKDFLDPGLQPGNIIIAKKM